MASIGSILFSIAILLFFCESYGDFPSDFLGNYVSDEEYDNRTLCRAPVCMKESGLLIYAADLSLNKTSPCDDFKTFGLGNFFKHRVPNDRYPFTGFYMDALLRYWEKQKRRLLKPIKESDPKIFKIMKSYFRSCINTSYIESQGPHDVLDYARCIGIVADTSQNNVEHLEVGKSMAFLSKYSLRIIFDHDLTYCKNGKREIMCLKSYDFFTFSDLFNVTDIVEMIRNLKMDKSYKKRIAENFVSFLKLKTPIQDQTKLNENETLILTFREMFAKFPSKHLDWLEIVNSQLLNDSHVKLNDTILVQNPQLLEGLFNLFAKLDEIVIVDVLAVNYFVRNSDYYTAYFLSPDARNIGLKKPFQRFEQCLTSLQYFMGPALTALSASIFYDETVQKSATELVQLAVDDVVEEISTSENISEETKRILIEKIQSAKLFVMFPEDILNSTKIGAIYEDLDFDGLKSLFELTVKYEMHHAKLEMKPEGHWIKNLEIILEKDVPFYFTDLNVLNVPAIFTFYPYFHRDRSRFFNMATLYRQIIHSIFTGITIGFPNEDLSDFISGIENLADKSYVRWEDNGGVDLQLPSFKLTNRQMLWLCLAHQFSAIHHRKTPKDFNQLLQFTNNNLHMFMKRNSGFREAFQCGDLKQDEVEQIEQLQKEMTDIFKIEAYLI